MREHNCPLQNVLLCYKKCYCVTLLSTATSYFVLCICCVAVLREGRCMAASNHMQRIKTLTAFINSDYHLSNGRIFKIN